MNLTPGSSYEAVGGELARDPDQEPTAQTCNETVLINGIKASLTAYNVDGYNYFKLVDLGRCAGLRCSAMNPKRARSSSQPRP